ncbi:MAG: phosphonoacetaldehyde hydrolase [Anaeromicrobium sp.]|uniref:phosphonoacetaldehyde hydrolase n=1 Tax=Anaeromicrobium sp. TaxID=1929132 RepID=UPI002ED2CF2F|nr:phosphonoacetaldehyde hydrolase [Anaeromicrobium sp.]
MMIEGVIFDWAGTTVDFGCFAPVNVFIDIFKDAGIEVTMKEAREPMGMLKIDHIRAMLQMPRISALWEENKGRAFDENDVNELYSKFEPALMDSLSKYTDPIPEVIDTVKIIKEKGLKIGSTTGYTNNMMNIVTKEAKEKGYRPDLWVTPDATNKLGRPYPYMIYKNMEKLKLTAPWKVVKVGDTSSDIKEGVNAGVWSVGVIIGSSEMGLSYEEFNSFSDIEKEEVIKETEEVFMKNGADFTIKSMADLPELLETINDLINQGKRPKAR